MRVFGAALLGLLLVTSVVAIDIEPKEGSKMEAKQALEQADSLFTSRSYDSALAHYTEAAELGHDQADPAVEVEALAQMARISLIQGNVKRGQDLLKQAEARASESEPLGWSRYLGVRGRFEWQGGDLASARETFQALLRYCDVNALWNRAVDAANMMVIVSVTPEQQIEWSKRGIELAEDYEVTVWLGPLWNNLAATYYDTEKYDSALTAYLKAREYHWQHSGEMGKLWADYSVGMTYRKLGEYEKAASWLRPVLAWAERVGDHGAIGQACEDLGEVALATGNKEEGVAYLKRAREQYQKAGYDESWPQVWQHINERLDDVQQ